MTPWRTTAKHGFRIASLVVPSLVAWLVALSATDGDALAGAVARALGPVWIALGAAFVVRAIAVVTDRPRGAPGVTVPNALARLDVLTSSGCALAWSSAAAIVGAVTLGWASLAVVGLLGAAIFHLAVLVAFVALRRGDVLRRGTITRRFACGTVTEGDDVTEEIALDGVDVRLGFRLLVGSRMGPRWPTSRHAIDAGDSGAEIVLKSEIGPAIRGVHEAELAEVWLEDVFGICRSAKVRVGPARLTVLPRFRAVEEATPVLGRGIGPREPRQAVRAPTEGAFHLREYQPGDDVRRIHWVRSLSAGELIVRLPDEIPPDRPHVRLVLDTFFPDALGLASDAPSEVLDALVGAWLAIGRALATRGTRVTLVTAAPQDAALGDDSDVVVRRCELSLRAPSPALLLGAAARAQARIRVEDLLTKDTTLIVTSRALAPLPEHPTRRWIFVVPPSPVLRGLPWTPPSAARAPFPMGHPDNRWSRRRREHHDSALARRDHVRALSAMLTSEVRPPPGSVLATSYGLALRLDAIAPMPHAEAMR